MSAFSLPCNPNPWSNIAIPVKHETNPLIRQVAWDVSAPVRLPSASRSSSIVVQAREVIDSILNDPNPDFAANRQRLRTGVAAYPDSPDRALLEHLIETCSQANAQRQPGAPTAARRAVRR